MNKRKRGSDAEGYPLLGERARVRGTAILDKLEAHPKRPAALHSPAVHGENARNQFPHCTHEQTETGSDAERYPLLGERARERGIAILDTWKLTRKRQR